MPESEFFTDFDAGDDRGLIGRELGHYRIMAILGRGGMGVVYRAEDSRLKRNVALKVLPLDLAGDAERLARFRREAESLAALNHPNIVTIHSIEEFDGLQLLTMEEVSGSSLAEILPESGLSSDELIRIALALSAALAAAHTKGIVHRDLKPSNLMLTDDGRLKVLDFGLAKPHPKENASGSRVADDTLLTREQTIIGTAPYMSPEQIEGRPADGRSDIFSLGVVLYELATGRRPFQGGSSQAVMSKILESDALPVRDLRKDLHPRFEALVSRCLEKDPADRFQDPDEIRLELLLVDPRGPRDVVLDPRRWPRGIQVLAALAVVALLALVLRPRDEVPDPDPGGELGIVVMPFEIPDSPEEAYFAAGLTHGVVSRLNTVSGLRVVSPRSAAGYATKTAAQVAEELDVDYLLYGVVYLVGKDRSRRLIVTPELVRAHDGAQVWKQPPYERSIPDMSDVFTTHRDIANQVLDELAIDRTAEERAETGSLPTQNIEAYNLYLKGIYFWQKRNEADFVRAENCFAEALQCDPEFAQARIWLAGVPSARLWYCLISPEEGNPVYMEGLNAVMGSADDFPQTWCMKGLYQGQVLNDLEGAEQSFLRAIELANRGSKGYANAHHWYGGVLATMGRHEEALEQALIARRLDPVAPIIAAWVGLRHYYAGRPKEALVEFDKALYLDRDFVPAHWHRTWACAEAGDFKGALDNARRARELSADNVTYLVNLAWVEAVAGMEEEARAHLEEIREIGRTRFVSNYHLAAVHVALGDPDEAFRRLQESVDRSEHWRGYLAIDPRMKALRGDPRFADLLRQLGQD